jgi:hypothetical protein
MPESMGGADQTQLRQCTPRVSGWTVAVSWGRASNLRTLNMSTVHAKGNTSRPQTDLLDKIDSCRLFVGGSVLEPGESRR